MTITVYLHTILQKRTPDGLIRSIELAVPEGSTVADVKALLEITLAGDDLLVTVNGRMAEEDHPLQSDDRVDFIPAISGGTGL